MSNIVSAAELARLIRAARAAGKPMSDIFYIDWNSHRSGNCSWFNIYSRKHECKGRSLNIKFENETNGSTPEPFTDEGVAELLKNKPNASSDKRLGPNANISIKKYSEKVMTEADGITVLKDVEGKPMYPGEQYESNLFIVLNAINEVLRTEATERIERGTAMMNKITAAKKANPNVTAVEIAKQFSDEHGPFVNGHMILTNENLNSIRRSFPVGNDALIKGANIVANSRVTSIIQEFISDKAKINAGMSLPNPIARIAVPFDADTRVCKATICDGLKSFETKEGKLRYLDAKINDVPVNADNIHHFLTSGALVSGIVDVSGCFSTMGISIPIKVKAAIVTQQKRIGVNSMEDFFETPSEAPQTGAAMVNPETLAAVTTDLSIGNDDIDDILGS